MKTLRLDARLLLANEFAQHLRAQRLICVLRIALGARDEAVASVMVCSVVVRVGCQAN